MCAFRTDDGAGRLYRKDWTFVREMKAYGVSVPYKAMVTGAHVIGWTLSDLFTELVREREAMHQ